LQVAAAEGGLSGEALAGKSACFDLTQADLCDKLQYHFMYEMKLNRKWGWWQWSVSDHSGKVAMFGREISRPAARYKAARALFQLLLTTSTCCDPKEAKRRQRR
jgi:hypothetical protein